MGKLVNKILGVKPVNTAGMKFTPYSLTTPMGSSYFDTKTKTGGYNLSPELQGMWDKYLAGAQSALPSEAQTEFAGSLSDYGKTLFGTTIGKDVNMDTEAMAKDYYNQQRMLLEPSRAQESSRLNDLMFSGGTVGQGVGMGGGYVNPQQYALQMAREQENAALAAGSTDRALALQDRARQIQQEDLQRALGYYGMGQELAYQPYQQSSNILGYGTSLQTSALPALSYGLQAGQSSAQAGANVAQAQNQQNQNTLGFWGGLLGGARKA